MMKKVPPALGEFYRAAIFLPAALLPVYSHLFPICAGGD